MKNSSVTKRYFLFTLCMGMGFFMCVESRSMPPPREDSQDRRTFENFKYFKGSNYQQKRFLENLNLENWSDEDQENLIRALIENPKNPSRWIELKNCGKLCDDHFIAPVCPNVPAGIRQPDGDTKIFIIEALTHLSVEGCSKLTQERFLSGILSAGQALTYLDISRTSFSGSIKINLPKLKTLRMNHLNVGDSDRSLTSVSIDCPHLRFLECQGAVHLKSFSMSDSSSGAYQDGHPLEYLDFCDMALLNDQQLDELLFRNNKKGEKYPKFLKLRTMDLRGTKVTLPLIRGMLPSYDTEEIKKIEGRVQEMKGDTAMALLESLSINTRRITGVADFFYHTGHFMKNFIGGVGWDLYHFGGVFKKIGVAILSRFKKTSKSANESEVDYQSGENAAEMGVSGGIGSSQLREGGGLLGATNTTVAQEMVMKQLSVVSLQWAPITASGVVTLIRGLTPEMIAAGATSSTISVAAALTGVGAGISGAIWIGRAAYWEHQRINREIRFAQYMMGRTLRAALEKQKKDEIDLSYRELGDFGLEGLLFTKEQGKPHFGPLTQVDLTGNTITDKGARIIIEALGHSPQVFNVNLEENKISDELLANIGTILRNNRETLQISEPQRNEAGSDFWKDQINFLGDMSGPRISGQLPEPKRFGLSLDGGGMRGLILARELLEIQRILNNDYGKKKIHEVFDYIGGSSIGGIVALGLTMPVSLSKNPMSPQELVNFFHKEGRTIFKSPRLHKGLIYNAKHSHIPLEGILGKKFGKIKLSDALTPVVITGVRTDKLQGLEPFIFDSERAKRSLGDNFFVKDVARATSAAPKYFQQAHFRNLEGTPHSFWDGGVWQNNPSQLVVNGILTSYPGTTQEQVAILSLGTGMVAPDYSPIWSSAVYGNISPLIFGQMDLSQEGVTHMMKDRFGDHYIRVQPKLRDTDGGPFRYAMDSWEKRVVKIYEESTQKQWAQFEPLVRKLLKEREDRVL